MEGTLVIIITINMYKYNLNCHIYDIKISEASYSPGRERLERVTSEQPNTLAQVI